ncbi:MAG: hypothetical protein ACK5LP_03690 [Campylobacteraceae bacterium]
MKKLLLSLTLLVSISFSVETKSLDDQLWDAVYLCKLNLTKELIEKGANKDITSSEGHTLYDLAILHANRACGGVSPYLSSIGVKQEKVILADFYQYTDKLATEGVTDGRLLIKFVRTWQRGGGQIEMSNVDKDDDTSVLWKERALVITSEKVTVNGESRVFKYTDRTQVDLMLLSDGNAKEFSIFSAFDITDDKILPKTPRVVNNKIEFTQAVEIGYTYKGKDYVLKVPTQKLSFDAKYIKHGEGLAANPGRKYVYNLRK